MRDTRKSRIFCLLGLLIMMSLAACGAATPAKDPVLVKEYFERGNELSQTGEFEKAVDEYKKVLEIEPQDVDAMSNLGVAYYNLGQLDDAIGQYSKAIELAPDDADIHSNLAAAYVQQYQVSGTPDQLERALEEYQKAVKLKPDLPEAYFGLGVVYVLLQRNQDAIEAFVRFQELDTGKDSVATDNAMQYLKQLRGQ